MKKKILIILVCGILTLCLTGCNSKKEEGNNEDKNAKNYKLEEVKLDCDLDNITYINSYSLISNGQINIYSDKKYSDTNSNCKPVSDNNNYHYLGDVYWHSINRPAAFTTDGNDIYYFNSSNELTKASTATLETYKEMLNDYKNNDFYIKGNGFSITDEVINYIPIEKSYTIELPKDEKILYATNYIYINGTSGVFIITDKNSYVVAIADDDKCHEYVDIECTYQLIKTNAFDDLLNDFKDNISYFDGVYLATKDNKIYKVNFYN